MNKLKQFLLASSVLVILVYLGMSFVFWELNPNEWGQLTRTITVAIMMFIVFIAGVITFGDWD